MHDNYIVRFRAISEIPEEARWSEDIFTAIGNELPMKKDRETILYGRWETNEYKGQKSLQFRTERSYVLLPTEKQHIENVLANEIPGIGKKMAKTIVDAYGEDTFSVLENGPTLKNEIPKSKAIAVREFIQKEKKKQRICSLMALYSLKKCQAKKALKKFGDQAEEILRKNVYHLYQADMTLDMIDKINHNNVPADDMVRYRAAIFTALKKAAKDGHVFLPEDELIERVQKLLYRSGMKDIKKSAILFGLDYFRNPLNDEICYENDNYYLKYLYDAESMIAVMVKQRINHQDLSVQETDRLKQQSDDLAKAEGVILAPEQKRAVYMSQVEKLLIITGGPGTGKTTTINLIIKKFQQNQNSILLMAPTGCATKRMIQTTSYKNAGTIHSKIGYFQDSDFIANRRIEEDVIIIDECSMIPCDLFRDIFLQVRPDATIILVGDKDQLDPIGPGRVFADLIESRVVPTVVLDHIFRQGKNSMIPLNSKNINIGSAKMLWNNSDFQLIRIENGDERQIAKKICEVYEANLKEYNPREIQILTPLKKKNRHGRTFMTSTEFLNEPLEKISNLYADSEEKITFKGKNFNKGDKVMETSNSNVPGIINGDIGEILSIDKKKQEVLIQFDTYREVYKKKNLNSIELAYATTIHKAQGNEYPVVIIPLMKSYYRMLTRKLLYTAVTRAKKKVIFVGSLSAFYMAVRDDFTEVRYTSLKQLLQRGMQKLEEQKNIKEFQNEFKQLEFSLK